MRKVILALVAAISLTGSVAAKDSISYQNGVYTNAPKATKKVKSKDSKIRSTGSGSYVSAGPRTVAKKLPPKPRPRALAADTRSYAPVSFPNLSGRVFSYADSGYKRLPYRPAASVVGTVDISEIIMREARNNDLDPMILEIIIKNESNFDPYATSGVGAMGLMQLMPETAADLGVTDPYNPHQNVAGGARYFAQQLAYYGDLRLALAAYNAGPGNVDAYGGVPPFDETIGYVERIAGEYQAYKFKSGTVASR